MMSHRAAPKPFFAYFAAPPSRTLRIAFAVAFACLPTTLKAQDAKSIVSTAVQVELAADRNDHSAYMYRDHDITPDHDTLYYTVETPQGNLRKKLEDHGRPLPPDQRQADDQKIQALLNDPAAQQRARKDSSHDDNQAEQMLRLLPQAYIWTITSETPSLYTLSFKPDPAFNASTYEARVLAAMGGQITVSRPDNHIDSIKGTLLDDVTFGYGIFGRLHKGGSFEVIRREVAPNHWQMTDSHVHIAGRALFFKSIGSQEDETRTDFKPSPAQNLREANEILKEVH